MSRPVLVTGAAGFAGGHLLEQLERDREPMVAWSRRRCRRRRTVCAGCGSTCSIDSAVARALEEVDAAAVYHLAGSAHVAQSWHDTFGTFQGNVLATHHLFEGLRGNQARPRVLVACSAYVYAPQPRPIRENDEVRPASPYATSKLAVEMLAERAWQEDGIPVIIARAFNHIGPRQDPSFVAASIARQIALIEAGRFEPVLTLGNLEPKRDLTDVRDTVRAYTALLDRGEPGQPYNVCSGRAIAVGELVTRWSLARGNKCASSRIRSLSAKRSSAPGRRPQPHHRGDRLDSRIPFEQTVHDLLHYWRATSTRCRAATVTLFRLAVKSSTRPWRLRCSCSSVAGSRRARHRGTGLQRVRLTEGCAGDHARDRRARSKERHPLIPVSVLALVLTFRERLDIVAGAWAIMAFGDGFATVAGTTMNGARLPWNPRKSWNGLLAFVVAGSVGGVALMMWVAPAISPMPAHAFVVVAPIVAAIVAGFVETIPIRLDDNISVPATAGAVLWLAGQVDQAALAVARRAGRRRRQPAGCPYGVARRCGDAGWRRPRGLFARCSYTSVAILAGHRRVGCRAHPDDCGVADGPRRKQALRLRRNERAARHGNVVANCGVGRSPV